MATSLVDSMTEDFDPDQYHDEYREALQQLIEAKIEGREVSPPPEPAAEEEPASLLDALQASLDANTRGRGPAPAKRRAGQGSRQASA
jgi:DNA end-binding protein Ku